MLRALPWGRVCKRKLKENMRAPGEERKGTFSAVTGGGESEGSAGLPEDGSTSRLQADGETERLKKTPQGSSKASGEPFRLRVPVNCGIPRRWFTSKYGSDPLLWTGTNEKARFPSASHVFAQL